MTETAMAAALRRAGLTEGKRLHAVIAEALKDAGGGRAKVRETLRSKVLASTELLDALLDCAIAAVAEDMQGSLGAGQRSDAAKAGRTVPASGDTAHEMPGGGQNGIAEEAEGVIPPTRQQNGDGAGSARNSDSGTRPLSRPSPTSRGAGAKAGLPKGQPNPSPAREQSEAAKRAARAVARVEAQTVLDRFRITERNGAMTPIGDVSVDRLDSLIYYTGRRRWVADREHTLLCLVKEDVSKFPQVPEGKLLREIFDEKAIQSKIDLAARMIKPIEDRQEAVNA